MLFGIDEKQKLIMAYLYNLRNTPESPPDERLSIRSIAKHLNMKQREVRDNIRKLIKQGYVGYFTFEGNGYCKLLPRGIFEMEKGVITETELAIGTDRLGVKRKSKQITLSDQDSTEEG
jgi:DNA-binding Lrp family transcriptional regulator